MDKIPLFKVWMRPTVLGALEPVLNSGYIGQGPKVDEFEAALSKYLDAPHILTVNSCTSAIDLALHLCGVGPGDEVITTPQTCSASVIHIAHRGATIVWADVQRHSGNIEPDDVERKITKKTKAILAVDWAGLPCDYDWLRSISGGVPIIEDAAHAFGARYGGEQIAQSGGDYVCWSFQAIKHLTTGDGGAIHTPRDVLERARLLRWYGFDRRGSASFRCAQDLKEAGYKYHMNDIAATIGLENLKDMDWMLGAHRTNAARFEAEFDGLPHIELLLPKYVNDDLEWASADWIFTLLVDDRESFQAHMADAGIDTSEVHRRNDRHTAFRNAMPEGQLVENLPGLNEFAAKQISIPCGWWVGTEERNRIVEAVQAWSKK